MKVQELRSAFLDFFRSKGHLIRLSAPLILDDPTTFFTSAGVQPYVPAFRGEEAPPAPTVASCQKCARMGDLDGVGRKARYHTFFEMLGNFSFGDYFKEGGLQLAWEFLTAREWMGLEPDRLWVTIFETDDEAEEIWQSQIGVPAERIVRFGREDNWWPKVRWEGPCGPCSEVHIDLGPELSCGKPTCRLGCDCNRYLELWNVVFQQYTEAEDGTLTPLPKPGVDTGMGLERLAMVMQGKRWSMETDELWTILTRAREALSEAGGAPPVGYGADPEADIALRVIADHTRAIAFLMADGATPSNVGPGYVLRRLIRRAHRFGRSLGASEAFLHAALPSVADVSGEAYPELLPKRDFTAKVVHSEEERFGRALGRGLQEFDRLQTALREAHETVIPGEQVFALMATYGLPVEVTEEMAEDAGLTVDREGFAAAMAAHAKRSAGERKGLEIHAATTDLAATEFVGYEATEAEATIITIERDDAAVEAAEGGDEVEVALDRTPLYAERGGQVGDRGWLESDEARGEILDVTPGPGDVAYHRVRVTEGALRIGAPVVVRVDTDRRRDIMRHHTATHLLQAALRQTLGPHVTQQGSLVVPDRLRFDFTHPEALGVRELAEVEDTVNAWIVSDAPVTAETKSREEAVDEGAIALFGEKYGETVRVVKVPGVSAELCGGTHCSRTGEIGSFRITSEGSAAANVRRIEAVCGLVAIRRARERDALLGETARALNCAAEELPARVAALREQLAEAKRAAAKAAVTGAVDAGTLLASARSVGPARLVTHRLNAAAAEAAKTLVDDLVARGDGIVAVVASVDAEAQVMLFAKAADGLVAQGAHAGGLVKAVAAACGGRGGGKPTFAQAGGGDPERLDGALAQAAEVLAKQLGV